MEDLNELFFVVMRWLFLFESDLGNDESISIYNSIIFMIYK